MKSSLTVDFPKRLCLSFIHVMPSKRFPFRFVSNTGLCSFFSSLSCLSFHLTFLCSYFLIIINIPCHPIERIALQFASKAHSPQVHLLSSLHFRSNRLQDCGIEVELFVPVSVILYVCFLCEQLSQSRALSRSSMSFSFANFFFLDHSHQNRLRSDHSFKVKSYELSSSRRCLFRHYQGSHGPTKRDARRRKRVAQKVSHYLDDSSGVDL